MKFQSVFATLGVVAAVLGTSEAEEAVAEIVIEGGDDYASLSVEASEIVEAVEGMEEDAPVSIVEEEKGVRRLLQEPLSYNKIYFLNQCNASIDAVIKFKNLDDTWVEDGWFTLAPGEKFLLAESFERFFFPFASSSDGKLQWKGDDHCFNMGGETICANQVDIGPKFMDYTFAFHCP